MQPSVGRIVHVVHPSPSLLSAEPVCRPAIIIEVVENDEILAAVFTLVGTTPQKASFDEDEKKPGTWHWPEQV